MSKLYNNLKLKYLLSILSWNQPGVFVFIRLDREILLFFGGVDGALKRNVDNVMHDVVRYHHYQHALWVFQLKTRDHLVERQTSW